MDSTKQYLTLAELWILAGKQPFDAIHMNGLRVHFETPIPSGTHFIGWTMPLAGTSHPSTQAAYLYEWRESPKLPVVGNHSLYLNLYPNGSVYVSKTFRQNGNTVASKRVDLTITEGEWVP